jgi:hypothetical protein
MPSIFIEGFYVQKLEIAFNSVSLVIGDVDPAVDIQGAEICELYLKV